MAEEVKKSDTAKREEEVLAFWKKEKIFEKSLEKEAPNGDFVFYDGPPFATGLPHYGSLLSSVVKDVFGRYKTMQGYHVRRRWGWDCHGLPIESMIEKELGLKTKKDIETLGVEKFNEAARNAVLRLADEWEWYVDRIGRWSEFSNAYKTMDNTYIESVWWALKTINEKGLLYEGRKVLLYCPHCETPLAKAEIAQDNSYKDITEEAVTVRLKVVSPEKHNLPENTYLLAWTTTPWTLPGNSALAVGEDIEYGVYEKGSEVVVVAAERAKHYELTEEIKRVKGSELLGIEYEPLFTPQILTDHEGPKLSVFKEEYVSTEDGTGIVHTGTVYGEEDYALILREGLPTMQLLDASGKYNDDAPEFLRGKFIKDAEKGIKDDLEKRGLLYEKSNNTHSYPHCHRCDTALLYNAISSWFINIQKVKEKIVEKNEDVSWHPEYFKHGRFQNLLENAPDWTISRNRYWASPLPIWKCEGCKEFVVIGSVEELKEKSNDDVPEDLHRPYIDGVTIPCSCGGTMKRIPEVVDCWVESSSMPFAERHYPFENKEDFERNFPADFIAEYTGQLRTWFNYMHVMAVVLFGEASYKNVVVTGNIQGEDGRKMSKSYGNFTDTRENFNLYGGDAIRLYEMGSPVMQAEDVSFKDIELREVHNKMLNILWNTYSFYSLHEEQHADRTDSPESEHVLDRWVVARTNQVIGDVAGYLDEYNTVKAVKTIRLYINDLSTWYIRRSRDRLKANNEDQQASLRTTRWVLRKTAKFLAPLAPFMADALWLKVKRETDPESVHLTNWCTVREYDEELLGEMKKVRDTVSLALEARASAGMKVRQPLASLTLKDESLKGKDELLSLILEEVNVKEVLFDASQEEEVKLDTELTDDLKKEGAVRDLIRHIQSARKSGGLTPDDRPLLTLSSDEAGKALVEEYKDTIVSATLLSDLVLGDVSGDSVKAGDSEFVLGLSK